MSISQFEQNSLLREVIADYDFKNPTLDLGAALESMHSALSTSDNGYALAANQIGLQLRAFIIGEREYINPRITKQVGVQQSREGCLSFSGLYITRTRPARIWVKYYDRHGVSHAAQYTELKAIAFCHELDHLNGVVFTDCEYTVSS